MKGMRGTPKRAGQLRRLTSTEREQLMRRQQRQREAAGKRAASRQGRHGAGR